MHNYHLINLIKKDFNITIVSIWDKINSEFYEGTNVNYKHVKVPYEGLFNFSFKFKILGNYIRALKDWIISRKMYDKFSEFDSDIIEFMDISSESYCFLKEGNFRNKTKLIIRSHTPWTLLRKYYSKMEKINVDTKYVFERESFCFDKCDKITTPSKDLKDNLVNIFNLNEKKIIVLPNIIDTNHFRPLPEIKKKDTFIILHVGRFNRAKGALTLIEAFINLAKEDKNIFLVNVGKIDNKIYSQCDVLLEKSNLKQNVSFENFISYDDLPKFYQKASVVIVPSELYESFSYTVAQAMSCGRIVIASNIGGIPETLNYGKAGFLFEPGNIESLIKKIKNIYSNKIDIKKYELAARRYIVKNFSFDALRPKYIDFYNGQIKSKK